MPASDAPRRRATDRLRPKDLWYLLGIGLVIASLVTAKVADSDASHADFHAEQALSRLQEGRATSIAVTCAVVSAVAEQGRAVLVGSGNQDTPLTRALRQFGYPPLTVRKREAKVAGRAYVLGISTRVDDELQRRGRKPIRGLVRSDGTIDCKVLQRISLIPHPR